MRRSIAVTLTAMVLILVAGYAATASVAVAKVLSMRSVALLAVVRSDVGAKLDRLNSATIRTALAAMPLDQHVANVAMMGAVRQDRTVRARWLAVVSRMGWRDTPALQNMLYAAAETGDLTQILDIGDALLRRQQLTDQMIGVLLVAESDPSLRPFLIARLAARPSWRGVYLNAAGALVTRDQLLARFETIRRLQRGGARLDRDEVVPSILALDRAGLSGQGFALWQGIRPTATRPLDDTRFTLASRSYGDGTDSVPFQWRMMTGQGFSVDASRDGARAWLTIDWDGRGVPVFAEQQTSATPGRYALDVVVAPDDAADLSAIVFRLVCGEKAIAFRSAGGGSIRYVTADPVPCAYPVLQLVGEVQSGATTHHLAFERIAMQPLGAAAR